MLTVIAVVVALIALAALWRHLSASRATPEFRDRDVSVDEIVIRPYSKKDSRAVLDLWANHFFREVHRRPATHRDQSVFEQHLDGREPSTIWVATYEGSVIGFLGLTPPESNDGDAPIHGIAVRQAFRRHGVFSRLFQTAIDELKQNPATSWVTIADHSEGSWVGEMAVRAGFKLLRGSTYVLSLKGLHYPF